MGEVSVSLANDDWVSRGGIHAAGRAFYDGDLLDAGGLADLFDGATGREFPRHASELNGLFSVVREREDEALLVSDRIGSRALFYTTGGPVRVSDHFGELGSTTGDGGVPEDRELEFRMATYVSGEETLDPSIRKTRPGSVVRLDDGGSVSRRQYYSFRDDPRPGRYGTDQYSAWKGALDRAFERVVAVADGRQMVMGLSGGHDSRLVVTMLDRMDYDDVVLFTYSNIQDADYDLEVAREVIDDVGFDWFEIPLTGADVRAGHRSALWKDIVRGLGRSGMSHTHPVEIAIQEGLQGADAVDDDALRLHGHQLFGAGSYVPRRLLDRDGPVDLESVVDAVYDRHYRQYGFDRSAVETVKGRIARSVRDDGLSTGGSFETVERWYWRERIPNFLSMRALVRMEFDVWFPLMDAELLDLWNGVSRRDRYGKRLYERWVDDLYRETYGRRRVTASGLKRADRREQASGLERLVLALRDTPLEAHVRESKLRPYARALAQHLRQDGDDDPAEIYRRDPLLAFVDRERFERTYSGSEGPRYVLADEILRTADGSAGAREARRERVEEWVGESSTDTDRR
jgi:asparagine synthase (glutamine-hydrolysing)